MLMYSTPCWLHTVGHGKSEGIRVDIQDFNFYVRDVLQHIHMVKDEFPNIPLFLFGHSMVRLLLCYGIC
jgi:hypothetical protein